MSLNLSFIMWRDLVSKPSHKLPTSWGQRHKWMTERSPQICKKNEDGAWEGFRIEDLLCAKHTTQEFLPCHTTEDCHDPPKVPRL